MHQYDRDPEVIEEQKNKSEKETLTPIFTRDNLTTDQFLRKISNLRPDEQQEQREGYLNCYDMGLF